MISEEKIKRFVEDFQKEIGIEETYKNVVPFMHLRDGIVELCDEASKEGEDKEECHCYCDGCEDCERN